MKISDKRFFQGQWLVMYCEKEYSFQQIWIFLQQVDQQLQDQELPINKIYLSFEKGIPANVGRRSVPTASGNYDLSLTLKDGSPFTILEDETTDVILGQDIDISSPIHTISLLMPFLSSDPRWRGLETSSSALFLGSALANQGLEVKAQKLNLPRQSTSQDIWHSDVIGFTLFEDLLPQCMELLDQAPWKQGRPKPILAAGGPLITLNPLQAVYHLPAVNLFVRGEAELMFASLLDAIKCNNLDEVWRQKGFMFQKPGIILLSDFHFINRPKKFSDFFFNFQFLKCDQLAQGLEINFSRGCARSCLFCSKVQGSDVRKLPLKKIEQLFNEWQRRVEMNGITSASVKTININDDDLLQDSKYTRRVFKLLKGNGFRLWGIQTSLASFFNQQGNIAEQLLDLVDDAALFVKERPLLWLGTDAFLPDRAKRLGKGHFQPRALELLVKEFERRKILNYHYWISSDHLSDWQEFFTEFTLLHSLLQRFEYFALLPHAPFVIPYATTPLFRLLQRSVEFKTQIIFKNTLSAPLPGLIFPLVARAETNWPHLNRLLANESLTADMGFFDAIKGKDYLSAYQILYDYLKCDRLAKESEGSGAEAEKLKNLEGMLENIISRMMGHG